MNLLWILKTIWKLNQMLTLIVMLKFKLISRFHRISNVCRVRLQKKLLKGPYRINLLILLYYHFVDYQNLVANVLYVTSTFLCPSIRFPSATRAQAFLFEDLLISNDCRTCTKHLNDGYLKTSSIDNINKKHEKLCEIKLTELMYTLQAIKE